MREPPPKGQHPGDSTILSLIGLSWEQVDQVNEWYHFCVCVCVTVCFPEREREREHSNMFFWVRAHLHFDCTIIRWGSINQR